MNEGDSLCRLFLPSSSTRTCTSSHHNYIENQFPSYRSSNKSLPRRRILFSNESQQPPIHPHILQEKTHRSIPTKKEWNDAPPEGDSLAKLSWMENSTKENKNPKIHPHSSVEMRCRYPHRNKNTSTCIQKHVTLIPPTVISSGKATTTAVPKTQRKQPTRNQLPCPVRRDGVKRLFSPTKAIIHSASTCDVEYTSSLESIAFLNTILPKDSADTSRMDITHRPTLVTSNRTAIPSTSIRSPCHRDPKETKQIPNHNRCDLSSPFMSRNQRPLKRMDKKKTPLKKEIDSACIATLSTALQSTSITTSSTAVPSTSFSVSPTLTSEAMDNCYNHQHHFTMNHIVPMSVIDEILPKLLGPLRILEELSVMKNEIHAHHVDVSTPKQNQKQDYHTLTCHENMDNMKSTTTESVHVEYSEITSPSRISDNSHHTEKEHEDSLVQNHCLETHMDTLNHNNSFTSDVVIHSCDFSDPSPFVLDQTSTTVVTFLQPISVLTKTNPDEDKGEEESPTHDKHEANASTALDTVSKKFRKRERHPMTM